MRQPSTLYKRHRFPGEIISHVVWLYYRFLLSYRDVEELLAEQGIAVSYETVRRWCRKFGAASPTGCGRRSRPGDTWHVDEVQLKINGTRTGSGGPSTRKASCSTSWCSRGATRRRPRPSCAAWWQGRATSHGW